MNVCPSFRRFPFLVFLLWICSFHVSAQADLQKLDAYYQKALKDWNVPGMAIAIVKNDSVIFAKGYGVLDAQKGGAVDANTVFGIASNSKAYTAAALGILVDEGKLNWDDPVTKYLPYLQLYSPYVTQQLNIKDLLSHRAGFQTYSGDLLWYNTTYTRKEILQRAKYLEPTYSFRSGYGYSNLMFIAAGEVIEAVSGKTWEQFIQERFFGPLGMTRSYTSVNQLKGITNVATPHANPAQEGGKPVPTVLTAWDNWNPAAGIFTSALQHAQWVRLQLNRGTYNGKRIFSEAASHQMWTMHNPFPIPPQAEEINPTTHFSGAGLGWMLNDYEGRKIIAHGGGHEGMNSRTVLVPEEKLGIVILTNSMSSIMAPIATYTVDQFLGIKNGRDWSQFNLDMAAKFKKQQEAAAAKKPKEKAAKAKLLRDLNDYVGTYRSPLYGDAVIRLQNGKLVLDLVPAPALGGELSLWKGDIFDLDWKNDFALLTPTRVRFLPGKDGAVAEMRLDANNPDFHFSELEFKRVK
ncbi:serine hydrolase [Rufibacter quisquiliarum]|uniref:CubicO group peptidase (Beta-lactamase class C family) n=1 Tax=Rufibacter quisquiliarum TaxID=1549639 RepID=A0A839GJM5_9BACT|nr:serine hydrolase [Rufibacter quisquiliarum]MBA9079794.1 CubicO group peptidase (beta-lactamase class C family) [Rufibacter quisquiliarum]